MLGIALNQNIDNYFGLQSSCPRNLVRWLKLTHHLDLLKFTHHARHNLITQCQV